MFLFDGRSQARKWRWLSRDLFFAALRHFFTLLWNQDLPEQCDDRRHAKALSRGEMHVFIAKKKPGKLKIIGISTH